MVMAKYSKSDMAMALNSLRGQLDGCVSLVVTHKRGNYFRVDTVDSEGKWLGLTWDYACLSGITVRTVDGVNVVSLTGYGYSKSLHIVLGLINLAGLNGTDRGEWLRRNYREH